MRFLKIIAALTATLAMLVVASMNSRGRPERLMHTEGAYTFEMTSVPKILEHQTDTVRVKVTGPMEWVKFQMRSSQTGNLSSDSVDRFAMIKMVSSKTNPDSFSVGVTAGDRGGRFHYYFQIVDAAGRTVARFAQEDGKPFTLKYIGEVPKAVLAGHLVFIFATVFFVSLATIEASKVIRGSDDIRPMAVGLFWAAVFCFIGGYPLGIPMNYYAFNGAWEGVPFGTDATDNKTQLMFVYLLMATLTTIGTFSRGRFGRDLFAPRTRGWIGLSTFAVMLFIYLIPHSIQFSARFTYGFCYSWIGLVSALYLFGLLKSRATAR